MIWRRTRWKLSWFYLHAAVNAAREHSAELVDLDLCYALTHVLEETAVLVLARVEEERGAHRSGKRPDLGGKVKCNSLENCDDFYGIPRNFEIQLWSKFIQTYQLIFDDGNDWASMNSYLDVTICRSRHEELFMWIHRQALDCVVMSLRTQNLVSFSKSLPSSPYLETMSQGSLSHVKYAHVTFLSGRNQKLVLRSEC
jgi:hypothetical protein